MTVPYTFATATTSLPLNQLDSNFNTPITLGNTAVYLGNTTNFIGNLALGNVAISSGNVIVTSVTTPTITSPVATALTLQSAGNTAITVDTSQNVGIGTSSPAAKLDVSGAGNLVVSNKTAASSNSQSLPGVLDFSGSGWNTSLGSQPISGRVSLVGAYDTNIGQVSPSLAFSLQASNGSLTERMRIDSSGNVGIGVTPSAWSTSNNTKALQVSTLTSVYQAFAGSNFASNTFYNGSNDVYITTAFAGKFSFDANVGNFAWNSAASGTAGTTATFTERMRIDTSGNLLVGTTSTASFASAPAGVGIYKNSGTWQQLSLYNAGAGAGCLINIGSTSTTGLAWDMGLVGASNSFTWRYNGTTVASINSSTGVYTPVSDINKKKDFEQLTNSVIGAVLSLKPTFYRMKTDNESAPKQLGFIAQEVQKIIPEAFVQDGQFIGLNQTPIIAFLVKAIQEQQAMIQELNAKVDAQQALIENLTTRLNVLEIK